MIYRCLHDISESPRAAYGSIERELSGVALEVELQEAAFSPGGTIVAA
jgi:hypothetical protein